MNRPCPSSLNRNSFHSFSFSFLSFLPSFNAFHSFQPLSENAVFALIRKSAKKSCPLDPMPTSLAVGCLDVLLPVISRIVNLSLSGGHFCDEWKGALVTPILKPGLDPSSPCQQLALYIKTDRARCFRPSSQSYESVRSLANLTVRLP